MAPSSYVAKRNKMEPMEGEYKKLTCNSMLIEIIDVAVMNISGRFCDVSQLKYCAFIISEISQTTSVNSPWKH